LFGLGAQRLPGPVPQSSPSLQSSSLAQAAPGSGTQVRDRRSHSCSGGQGSAAAAGEVPGPVVGSHAIAGR
jgi:hypothetical protein